MQQQTFTPEQLAKLGDHLATVEPEGYSGQYEQTIRKTISEPIVQPISNISLKDKIAALEKEYRGETSNISSASSSSYRDDMGNDTYYVKNMSGGILSLEIIKDSEIAIPAGKIADLLVSADIEQCYASRDIRKCLTGINGKEPWLKRLTPLEYSIELEREVVAHKKLEAIRQNEALKQQQIQQQNPNSTQSMNGPVMTQGPKIRAVVYSKLEKLRLASVADPELSKYGMSSTEFIQWVMVEALTEAELDCILGDPSVSKRNDIKTAVIEKKSIS